LGCEARGYVRNSNNSGDELERALKTRLPRMFLKMLSLSEASKERSEIYIHGYIMSASDLKARELLFDNGVAGLVRLVAWAS
jgi:hypothetical protein